MGREEKKASLQPLLLPIAEENGVKSCRKEFHIDEIVVEVKKQLCLVGPLVSVNLLVNSLQVISVMYVGHLGELALSGASMATSFASVTGFSLLRAMIVLLLACIPLALIWANTGQILAFLGQDPEISAEAGLYARFLIPCIFGYALLQCHIRFLQAQNNVLPMMVSTAITTLSHLLICWILVFKSGLGNKGAALANGISYWMNALLLMAYVRISPSCKSTWTGFSKEAFRGITEFLKLSIPSAIMLSLEIWSFEMMVLLSGLLPNPKLEASVLSISIRVSNELGSGRPQAARLAVRVALSLVATEGILVGTALILGRNVWGYCYSQVEEVLRYVGEMLLLVAISHFFDGLQSVLSGAARGCGWQKIGAFVNLGAYYLAGIPVAILLAFVFHIGGKGLWMGIIVALIVQALCLGIITLCTNWENEVKKAAERVKNSSGDSLP
ncbi:protein detoxification 15 [Quercus suber]|uniref:Protein detoxification 15 n=1 Tax=Quercus suber TaxID=58331 RepID=A0AAW0L8E7_QUESU